MVLTRIHNFFLNQNRKRERFLSLPSFLLERRESMATGATTTLEGLSLEDEQQIIFSNTFTKELLDAFYNNNDKEQQLYALRMIRKLLSRARGAPIQQVLDSGILPNLAAFLKTETNESEKKEDENQRLQDNIKMEAAWALTNIASGTTEQTDEVVRAGCVPSFVSFLTSKNNRLRGQAIWALGNISGGDNTNQRDTVLAANVLKPLLHNLINSTRTDILQNGTFCLASLCRGKPPPKFDSDELERIARVCGVLLCSPDVGVLSDVCWTLSFLTDDSNEKRSIVLDVSSSLSPSIIEKLVEYLDHDDIQNPALRAIGNLLAGEERHTQAVLDDPRVLPCFKKLLSHERQREVKETCYALSNISAGNPQQLQSLIQANFFPIILQMYYTVGVDDIKSEIGFIFSNATTGGVEQVEYLMENMPMFEIFLEFLEGENEGSIEGCLEGIENILKAGANNAHFGNTNPYVALLKREEKFKNIKKLQDSFASAQVTSILKYFDEEDL